MKDSSRAFLYQYLNNPSPTGFEAAGQKIWLDYLRPYADAVQTDVYGTAVVTLNPGQAYSVVLEAHADEISWLVSYITADGFIYVKRNGGSDPLIAPSKRVNIFTDKGIVKGVFGWPAIHVRKEGKDDAPRGTTIFIDVGASSEEEVREMGIYPGTVLTFDDELTEINGRYLCGRALDNRIGGFMIAEAAIRLKESGNALPFTLHVVNSVQEEVGLRGAEMISRRLKPNLAIITDVTHDSSTPMMDKIENGDIRCGRGPVLCVAPSVHNKVRRSLVSAAQAADIPIQHDSASRSTGTDTDAFAYSAEGVASALISLPLRYMHTTVEMVSLQDIEHTISLMTTFLQRLKGNESWSYFD